MITILRKWGMTKVVKSLTYVENRVNALIDAWGKTELEKWRWRRPKKNRGRKTP